LLALLIYKSYALLQEKEDLDAALVEDLMEKPRKLDDIDLDAFAEELEKNGKPFKKSILYDIKKEINAPFADPRLEYRDPDPNELFTMLTGETNATLKAGMLVNARYSFFDIFHANNFCHYQGYFILGIN
jgi:transcription elongation factor SPT6